MKTRSTLTYLALALLLPMSAAESRADIVPTSQDRHVRAVGDAYDNFGASDSELDTASIAGYGVFTDNVAATGSLPDAFGTGTAIQSSSIFPTHILASGSSSANSESYFDDNYGLSDGRSYVEVTFDLTAASGYTITGEMGGFDDGFGQLSLRDDQNFYYVTYETPYNGSDILNFSGALPVGTYTLVITANSSAYADPYEFRYGFSEFIDVLFALDAATGIPGGAAQTLTVAPNPTRGGTTISHGFTPSSSFSFAVYDIRGRLVRDFSHVAARRIEWNGRDESGRPVSPGTYFLKLANGGENALRKITILR
ncbi:MAG: T9SS type A sorting domain-containing protein [Gemmatimonadetes bacterium]|nr:T9SS type A sorting domain-containing protein [Gemmatimonadota bacterium]